MNRILSLLLLLLSQQAVAQSLKEKLASALAELAADSQMRHAIIGFSVCDVKTGAAVYEQNAETGLAPASTQKLFTSCAAFDLLGKDYTYSTAISYSYVKGFPARGYFSIDACGDPSLGSLRFPGTKADMVLDSIVSAVHRQKLTTVSLRGQLIHSFDNSIPNGWIWEDIGNYYGAGAQGFNWMENQYDLLLKSGNNVGDTVTIAATRPIEAKEAIDANLHAAEKGTGDNTVVYLPYANERPGITGTIPVNENAFPVSASVVDPYKLFSRMLEHKLAAAGIGITETAGQAPVLPPATGKMDSMTSVVLYRHISPPLDSLNYWFLKKSINLYGEALIKTMALKKFGRASTGRGVEMLKDFWVQQGIERSSMHLIDGSGLSPQNRVTTAAMVKVLQYAKSRPWFSSFYYDLPEYNGMKMKSGSIGGARAFAGYQTAPDGREYSFAIIVNNYDGSSAAVVRKIFRVLNNLK